MKFMVAVPEPPKPSPAEAASNESTEQMHHEDLGWSPMWDRMPMRDAFKAVMAEWSGRIECRNEGRFVIVILDGRMIGMATVRD